MKVNTSTAIAFALAFTSVTGNPAAAVSANSVSESINHQEQRITIQEHSQYEARRGYCFWTPWWGNVCC